MKKKETVKDNGVLGFIGVIGFIFGCTAIAGVFLMGMLFLSYGQTRLMEGKPLFSKVSDEKIESIIQFTGEVDETAIEEIKAEIRYLPEDLVAQFIHDDGIIIVEDEPLKVHENGDRVLGSCGIKEGQLIIYLSKGYMDMTVCHEFGHYLSRYANGYEIKDRWDFFRLTLDRASICEEVIEYNEYFESDEEYFAECFKHYVKGNLDAEKYEETISYIDSLVAAI